MTEISIPDIIKVFRFYEAMGFERLPVQIKDTLCRDNPCPMKEEALGRLRDDEIGECTRCGLSGKRTRIVFGEGNPDASLLLVGEAPGEEEDRQGRPFVGKAGQLLTKLIVKMGLNREGVYITNTVKCRPPDNRKPTSDEIRTCNPFLQKQIAIIKPVVIMTLGDVATKTILGDVGNISRIRGRIYSYNGIDVVPTFHPSYLLRNPGAKWQTWSDAQTVIKILEKNHK